MSSSDFKKYNLFNVKDYINTIVVDLKYATTDNLTGKKLYGTEVCYLHYDVIMALKYVQNDLVSIGLGLKIRDGYRPQNVQNELASHVNDTNFTPSISNHTKGIAVDCTLVDINTLQELCMPTHFDDLSPSAYPTNTDLDDTAITNREILISTMKKYGFEVYPYERWHFDYIKLLGLQALTIGL